MMAAMETPLKRRAESESSTAFQQSKVKRTRVEHAPSAEPHPDGPDLETWDELDWSELEQLFPSADLVNDYSSSDEGCLGGLQSLQTPDLDLSQSSSTDESDSASSVDDFFASDGVNDEPTPAPLSVETSTNTREVQEVAESHPAAWEAPDEVDTLTENIMPQGSDGMREWVLHNLAGVVESKKVSRLAKVQARALLAKRDNSLKWEYDCNDELLGARCDGEWFSREEIESLTLCG